ncbi:MAG: A/G-specific adenine glycosylase [bacterium]|nr:A/G-specific adenine glycosylase [bacterium]
MLQQTQVDRVVPKFEAFVARFPTLEALAAASVADVLRLWQGLGYNSRAIRLQGVAREVIARFGGAMPRDERDLRSLPGIGPYTAAAIRAFGFDEDDAPMDTNIRRIVHRLRFGIEYPPQATSPELDAQARALAPGGAAHDWNSAMMDLGATICTARAPKCLVCPLRMWCRATPVEAAALELLRKQHAKKPSPQNAIPFERTTRYARGRIVDRLRALPPGERISLLDLHADLQPLLPERPLKELERLVAILERDGLVACDGPFIALRD